MNVNPAALPPEPAPQIQPASGWSWGAFFLTWLWVVGTRTWKGLWTLVPFALLIAVVVISEYFPLLLAIPPLYLAAAIVLGRYGRRWSWASGRWESAERFNRVQRRWGVAGWIIVPSINLFVVFTGVRAMKDFKVKSSNSSAHSAIRNLKASLETHYSDNNAYPLTLGKSGFKVPEGVLMDCSLAVDAYNCTAAHKEGKRQYFTTYTSNSVWWREYRPGDPVRAPVLKGMSP